MPNSFAAHWLTFLSLISHDLFAWVVAGAAWAEPAPGCKHMEFTHFLREIGMIAIMGRGFRKDFGKKQKGKSLKSLQGSQHPCNKLLITICRFLMPVFDANSFLLESLPCLIKCPLQEQQVDSLCLQQE